MGERQVGKAELVEGVGLVGDVDDIVAGTKRAGPAAGDGVGVDVGDEDGSAASRDASEFAERIRCVAQGEGADGEIGDVAVQGQRSEIAYSRGARGLRE